MNNKSPQPGQQITYTIAMTNVGNITLTNASVSDTLPTGLSFAGPVTISPSGDQLPTPTQSIIADNLTITPGGYIALSFPVLIDASLTHDTTLTNVVVVTGSETIQSLNAFVPITVITTTTPMGNSVVHLPVILKS